MGDILSSRCISQTLQVFRPSVKFVRAGHEPKSIYASLIGNNIFRILPNFPINCHEYYRVYPTGIRLLRKLGWEFGQPLGYSAVGLKQPLEISRTSNVDELLMFTYTPLLDHGDGTVMTLSAEHNDKSPPSENPHTNNLRLLPHLILVHGETELLTLIDSGCEVSCINEQSFESIRHTCAVPTLPVTATRLRGAMGKLSNRVSLQAWLELSVRGSKSGFCFQHTFLVVKNLVRPIIIGIDWLFRFNARIDFALNSLMLPQEGALVAIPFNANVSSVKHNGANSNPRTNRVNAPCDVITLVRGSY